MIRVEPAVREIFCKSALTKSGITDYALNPYVGCAHNCVYCYASFMARFSRHDRPWGQWVDVKVNAPEALAADLRRMARRRRAVTGMETEAETQSKASPEDSPVSSADDEPAEIIMSSVTDPYQPLERTYRITRACLEVLAGGVPDWQDVSTGRNRYARLAGQSTQTRQAALFPAPGEGLRPAPVDAPVDGDRPASRFLPGPHLSLSVLTKSDLVVRDIDVLQDIPSLEAGFSITSVDDAVSRRYEPGASPASKRLAALKALSDAGIKTWAFISPVLPHHSDSERAMFEILRAVRDAGASRVMVDRFNPYPASVSRFLRVAPPEAATALKAYVRSQDEYLGRLRDTVRECASRLGMRVRVPS